MKYILTSRLLLLCVFIKTDDSTTALMLADQSVYENTTAVFTICNTANGYFTINNISLSNSSFKDDATVTSESSCHSLMFKAVLEYDNYKIGFREFQSTQDIDTAILHVQGVLQAPQNFDWQDTNSTHMTIVWDAPFSWLGHENTSYKLIFMQENKEILSITVQELNHTILRPSTHISVYLTAINPVGEGESSLLDLKHSLAYCGANEVIDHGGYHIVQLYMKAGYINIDLLQEIKNDRNYCLGISDQVKIIHELVPTNTHYSLTFEDNTIVITLYDLPPSKHLMNVTIILTGVKTFNINFSTYQVQGVNLADDSKRLQCQFLHGTTHHMCLVDIYDGSKKTETFSGSNTYHLDTITTPGSYILKIYDDVRQRDQGLEPAKVIIFNVDKSKEMHGLNSGAIFGGVFSVLIVLTILIVVIILLMWWNCFRPKPHSEIHTQEDIYDQTSVMITGRTTTEEPHRRLNTIKPAFQRDTENLDAAQVHIDINKVTASFTYDDANNVHLGEDREDGVIAGLPSLDLHKPAIIQVE